MKTYLAPVNEIEKKWYVVDAENKILGRLASEIANRLRGKHKPTFSAFIDNGDFIIVTNAEKIALTGNKLDDKKQNIKGTMGIRIYLNTMKQAFDAIIGTGIEAKYNEVDKGDYMEVVVKIPKK